MARSKLAALALFCTGAVAAWGGLAAVSDSPEVSSPLHEALACLHRGDYPQAEQRAMALASRKDQPTSWAWLIVATARQRQGHYVSAVRAYRLFLAYCGSPPLREFVLAQMRACEAAQKSKPRRAAPSRSLTRAERLELASVSRETFTESGEHFVVRTRNRLLAKVVAREAEIALVRICQVILAGQEYPHSVEINVWADRKEYSAHATNAPEWSGGNFSFSTEDGTVVRRIDLTQRDERGRFDTAMLDRILPHEMCHLVLREFFGDAACPLFLNEGLAMMAESEVDNKRVELAGVALAGEAKIPLESLLVLGRHEIESPDVFYAESFSLISFLHSRLTKDQFKALLEHIKDGCSLADALQRALYVAHKEDFVPALAAAWEDYAIEQTQYIRALRGADDLTFPRKG